LKFELHLDRFTKQSALKCAAKTVKVKLHHPKVSKSAYTFYIPGSVMTQWNLSL